LCESSNRSWRSTSLSRSGTLSYAKKAAAAVLITFGCFAAARGLVPAGLYEIIVTQELPNVAKAGEPVKLQVCLTKKGIESGAAFHVRSENPLRECPISGLRFNDDELIYRIICPQPNSPSAKAKFANTKTGYEGAITINMGGKNMTLTERHRAQRIGECPNDDSASVLQIDEALLPELVHPRGP
jgi:hypothetical protein